MSIPEILEKTRTIAVVGYSDKPGRPANYVPAYLQEQGYRILPVNPTRTGAARLADLTEPVDLVLLFRRSEDVPGHLDDILSLRPPPQVVWMQSGIRNETVARALQAVGIETVQDRCMLVEHQHLHS